MRLLLTIFTAFSSVSCGLPINGLPVQYPAGHEFIYHYETEFALGEADKFTVGEATRVGCQTKSEVLLKPIWHKGQSMLIELQVKSLESRQLGATVWNLEKSAQYKLPSYFEWSSGLILQSFLHTDDALLSGNYKKGIASLLQVSTVDGNQREEVDTTGYCLVNYQVSGGEVLKQKTKCSNTWPQNQTLMDVVVERNSETKYRIVDDLISSAEHEDFVRFGILLEQGLSSKLYSRQKFTLSSQTEGVSKAEGSTAEEVLESLGKKGYQKQSLETTSKSKSCSSKQFPSEVSKLHGSLLGEVMASEKAAKAFLSLVGVVVASSKSDIIKTLRNKKNDHVLPQLIDVIVASHSAAGRAALLELLDFTTTDDIYLHERYLLSTAFSSKPTEQLLQDLLNLMSKNIPSSELRESLAGCIGSVVYTFSKKAEGELKIVEEAVTAMIKKLKECKTDDCKRSLLRALSNTGHQRLVQLALDEAVTASEARISEAALISLRRVELKHLDTKQVRKVLLSIVTQTARGYDNAVRRQAIQYLIKLGSLSDHDVESMIAVCFEPGQQEFGTFVKAQLTSAAARSPKLRSSLTKCLHSIADWNKLALGGKSLSFQGWLAQTKSLAIEYNMYVMNSNAGLIKRGGMDVTGDSGGHQLNIYSVGLFSAGLESMIGDEPELGSENTVATAGLALDILDIALRPVTFFEGQSSLMAALWSAPSELVSALQANILLQDTRMTIKLQSGIEAELSCRGALSLDLSGLISVSLWNKNSHSLIRTSGSVLIESAVDISNSIMPVSLDASGSATANIDFVTDVDFYSQIKSCLQMLRPEFQYRRMFQRAGINSSRKRKLTSTRTTVIRIPGVSYPLPPHNSAQCRKMADALN